MYHNSESEIYLDLTNCLTAHTIVQITFLSKTVVSCNLVNVNVEICCLPPPPLCSVVVVVLLLLLLLFFWGDLLLLLDCFDLVLFAVDCVVPRTLSGLFACGLMTNWCGRILNV